MICTRCGTEQRRETARFCHVCGASIESLTASTQPNSATAAAVAASPQPAHGLRPISLTSPEPAANDIPEARVPEIRPASPYPEEPREPANSWNVEEEPTALSSQPFVSNAQERSSNHPPEWDGQLLDWQQEPPTITLNPPPDWQPMNARQAQNPAAPPSGWSNPDPMAYSVSQEERNQPPMPEIFQAPLAQSGPHSRPESSAWPEITGAETQQQGLAPVQNLAQPGWNSAQPGYGPVQPLPLEVPLQGSGPNGRERPFPAAQHRQRSMVNDPFGDAEARPAGRASPMSERPTRSAAGPVPGSLTRPRPAKRRRVPLGVTVTIGLLLVFILGGVGVYALASSSGGQEPSAFVNYSDPRHHFTIEYPNVWSYKHLDNGVRFTDATNTAELSITYTPNTSNLTAQQFADQEAQKQSLNAPDTRTFAGQTWVVRSGIVTQTSGIAQDIFIFVTVYNNLLYEVREVTPLDGYQQPNSAVFMPMLEKYLRLS